MPCTPDCRAPKASSIVRPRTALSPRFNMSGSFAMLEATSLASSIVICFASMASGLGRATIDICQGKTVRVPHHVAGGKFLGAPWGRKAARHSTSLRPLALSLIQRSNRSGGWTQTTTSWIALLLGALRCVGARAFTAWWGELARGKMG